MVPDLDPLDLECVVVLAETLSFTATAERLRLAQPAVSARIRKLEKGLGWGIFRRDGRMVTGVTLDGSVFVEEAKHSLEGLQRLIARSNAAHRAFTERILIARSHHTDLRLLSIVFAAQAIQGTKISLELSCNSDEDSVAMLLDGRVDVALVAWPVKDPQIASIRLTRDSLLVVLPENHPLRGRERLKIADLRNEQVIGSEYQFPTVLRKEFVGKCAALGFKPGCLRISASPTESVYLVDAGGTAITIVTQQYARELPIERATYVPFAPGEIVYQYGVAYRQNDHRPVLRTFLQYLVQRFESTKAGPEGGLREKASSH